jgi:hypothetical protein
MEPVRGALSCLLACLFAAASAHPGDGFWFRTGYALVSSTRHYLIVDVVNQGGSPEWRHATTGYDTGLQTVYGSPEASPPWTSKFTPLSLDVVWAEYSWNGFFLYPGYRQRGIMSWSTETGYEKWSWIEDPFLWPTYRRDREWHSGPVWSHRVFPNRVFPNNEPD